MGSSSLKMARRRMERNTRAVPRAASAMIAVFQVFIRAENLGAAYGEGGAVTDEPIPAHACTIRRLRDWGQDRKVLITCLRGFKLSDGGFSGSDSARETASTSSSERGLGAPS